MLTPMFPFTYYSPEQMQVFVGSNIFLVHCCWHLFIIVLHSILNLQSIILSQLMTRFSFHNFQGLLLRLSAVEMTIL